MIETGKKVKFVYSVKINGEETGTPLQEVQYTHGEKKIIPKLEEELNGLAVGEKKTIQISSEEGQIPYDEGRVKEVPKSIFKEGQDIVEGKRVQLKDSQTGQLFVGTVMDIKAEMCVVDLNHPLAGKDLEFDVEVLSVD